MLSWRNYVKKLHIKASVLNRLNASFVKAKLSRVHCRYQTCMILTHLNKTEEILGSSWLVKNQK